MNSVTTFSRSLFGLTTINADEINTGTLTATTMTAPTFKTNLVQSINAGNSLTLESLTTGQVIIKSNGANIAVFDTTNNLITFNSRVSQVRADGCTSYGVNCILNTATGTTSTAFGNGALRNVESTGFSNCAFGPGALTTLTTGDNNCAFGADALRLCVTNSGNMAIGLQALRNCVSNSNCAIGSSSSLGVTTGGGNTSIGTSSGITSITWGASGGNVSIGQQSNNGLNAFGGSNNTAIGHLANNTANTASFSNSTCIGFSSSISASNQITLGRTSEFVCCPNNLVVGRTTNSTGLIKFLVNGDSQYDGSLEVRTGGQIRLFNNIASSQTNITHTSNYLVMNCVESLGKIDLRINGASRLLVDEAGTLGKVLINSAGLNIFNNGLVFSKNTTATQTIEFLNSSGTGMGTFFASELSNAFVFDFNNAVTTQGYQVRSSGSDRLKITDTQANLYVPLDVSSDITTPTQPPGTNNTTVATTGFVQAAITAGGGLYATLAGANTFTGTNLFGNSIPTISTILTPSNDQQLINKGFADVTYARLGSSNTFTAVSNIFTFDTQFLQAPNCDIDPIFDTNLCRKNYVDKNAIVPPTKLFTFAEDFIISTGGGGFSFPSNWVTSGTGTATHAQGTDLNHWGIYTLTNNKTLYNDDLYYSGFPKQVKWVVRETTSLNTFNWYAGVIQAVGTFGNSAFIGHTSGGTTFFASVNNVNLYNFIGVTWIQNKWYEITIDFNNPDISFTIINLTDNLTETYIQTASAYNFARDNIIAFQHVSVSGTNTAQADFCSMSYQCGRT